MRSTVRFAVDDRYGLWNKGDEAEHLGRESEHPFAANIHLFRLANGEVIALHNPFGRRLVVEQSTPEGGDT